MKFLKYIIIICCFLANAQPLRAQSPTLIGSTYVINSGSGAAGRPSLTWNIPAGKNRQMIIMVNMERDHRPAPFADNFPGAVENSRPILTVGSRAVSTTTVSYSGIWSNSADRSNWSLVEHTNQLFLYYLSDKDGLPTGNTTFDFSNFNLPKSAADESSVTILVYDNISQNNPVGPRTLNFNADITDSEMFTISGTAGAIPPGRVANDILYVSFLGISTDINSLASIYASSGWNFDYYTNVPNPSGTPINSYYGEPNGISSRVYSRTYTSGNPSITYQRTYNSLITQAVGVMLYLNPLAKPSISGTVFNDTDGPANINGTVTNAGGLYVNAINNSTGLLIYSAAVNSSGVFTIPTGYVLEGDTYRLELSANTGTIGATAPAKVLPANWNTVGESSTGISPYVSDGLNDGTIVYTMANTNVTNLRYGINRCTNLPATGTPDGYTQTGISNLVGFANGWPGNVANGFIAIESKNKGFVITRVANTAAIATPVEGMLIYDNSANCVKLYYSNAWHCLAKDCG